MNNSDQLYIDHEVRIRMNEETYKDLREAHNETKAVLKELRQEISSNFKWTIAIIIGSVLLPTLLHGAKLM